MNVRFYISYDIKMTLQSHFWRKNVISLSSCMQRCYGRHKVSRKSVNHCRYQTCFSKHYHLLDPGGGGGGGGGGGVMLKPKPERRGF